MDKWNLVGIDYGSKLAGTTALAWIEAGMVYVDQSIRKKDADIFLIDQIKKLGKQHIFIDAPLSLPGVYRGLEGYEDYFYRKADMELKAMSPMFLGGLTARAMRLKDQLEKKGKLVYETYPKAIAIPLELEGYKKDLSNLIPCSESIENKIGLKLMHKIDNWHQFDALLALYAGLRHLEGDSMTIGDKVEGEIIF